jgi:hypothetical protein
MADTIWQWAFQSLPEPLPLPLPLYKFLKTLIPLADIAQVIRRERETIDIFPDEVSVQTK